MDKVTYLVANFIHQMNGLGLTKDEEARVYAILRVCRKVVSPTKESIKHISDYFDREGIVSEKSPVIENCGE